MIVLACEGRSKSVSSNSQLYSSFSLRNYIEFKGIFPGVEKIFARTCLLMTFLCSAGQGSFGRIGRQALRKSLLRTATVVNGGVPQIASGLAHAAHTPAAGFAKPQALATRSATKAACSQVSSRSHVL
jgi:hypothetical protein